MKIILITSNIELKDSISGYFLQRGYEIICYDNPLKAADNFKEIDPDVVLFNSCDFPRHWKINLKFLREDKPKDETVFILVSEKPLSPEEADKALYLGVNALYYNNNEVQDHSALEKMILRYKTPRMSQSLPSVVPSGKNSMDFSFMNPDNFQIVTGRLTRVSPSGGGFKPDEFRFTNHLPVDTVLKSCTLRSKQKLFTVDIKVVENRGILDFEFLNIPEDVENMLKKSLF